MSIETFFTDEEKSKVNEAVAAAERQTSAEIVPVLADASGDYDRAEGMCGLLVAMVAVATCWLLLQDVQFTGEWASEQNPVIRYGLVWVILTILVSYAVGVALASRSWVVRRLFTPKSIMSKCVERTARKAFHDFKVSQTREATGVLILISLFERTVYVLGDESISEKFSNSDFEAVRDAILEGFRSGQRCDGLCEGIRLCGEKLSPHFPIRNDDENEISNELRIYRFDG